MLVNIGSVSSVPVQQKERPPRLQTINYDQLCFCFDASHQHSSGRRNFGIAATSVSRVVSTCHSVYARNIDMADDMDSLSVHACVDVLPSASILKKGVLSGQIMF